MFEKKNQPDLVYQSHRVAKESITHFEEVLVQAILGAGALGAPGSLSSSQQILGP